MDERLRKLLWDAKRLLVTAPLVAHGPNGPARCNVCEFQHKLDAWVTEFEKVANSAGDGNG